MEMNNNKSSMRTRLTKSLYRATRRTAKVKPTNQPSTHHSLYGPPGSWSYVMSSDHYNQKKWFDYYNSNNITNNANMNIPASADQYGGDENVDTKAASYISCVRERLKLESF